MRLFLALALALLSGPALSETRVPESRAEISLSFAPLVREAAPAVVNIYARRVVETRRSPFAEDPFFGEFFREFGQRQPRVQNSLGSGVILSDDGIVVSNYHVIGQATDISVVLNDRREYSASVLLADEQSDLAILQLDGASDMPHLPLRDSDTVEVGELTLAIGNPFGVGQTVSSGIVSGLARSGVATGNMRGYFIQTDAPINPGNSGGALVDMNGDLVGINTQIVTRSGGSNGIGFAIPASLVAQFVAQARDGRLHILDEMAKGLGAARQDISENAPRITMIKIPKDKIREVIGPGGKMIREICEVTGTKIDLDDDGTVKVAAVDQKATEVAIEWIRNITAEPEIGVIYSGKVVKTMDFGAFVNFMGAKDGLVHISELAPDRVGKTPDVVNVGDEVKVKLIGTDDRGKVKLSLKSVDQQTGKDISGK